VIRALALLVVVVASVGGCKVRNEDFCCSTAESCAEVGAAGITPCTTAAAPFCDDTGEYEGVRRVCIADPLSNECAGVDDCPSPARPVCDVADTGTCVRCGSGADCARFPTQPLCDPAGGGCVECLAATDCLAATAPVCGADQTCRGCTADAECASGLCTEATGACVAVDAIVHVDAATGSGTACSAAMPCATLTAGVAAIGGMRTHIKVTAGTYRESVVIDGKSLTIVAPGATLSPVALDSTPLLVRNNSTVRVEGLRVSGALGIGDPNGIACLGQGADVPVLVLTEVQVDSSSGFGVFASVCKLTIERARLLDNDGGGLSTNLGEIVIRNSFIAKNGDLSSGAGGAIITTPANLIFEHNTVAENSAAGNVAAGVQCSSGMPRTLTGNIIVGPGATQVAANNCGFAYTLSNQGLVGTGNIMGTPTFVDALGDDYHLQPTSAGIDAADPASTVTVDIDGQPRPQGGRADIGADEVR